MKFTKCALALVAGASLVVAWGAALAATPTQADFDACNREAQLRASNPAASPGAGSSTGGSTGISGGARGGVTAGGSTSDTTSTSPGASGSGSAGTSTTTPSGSLGGTTTDNTLQGMAPQGGSDPAYQQAYRDCLQRRGF